MRANLAVELGQQLQDLQRALPRPHDLAELLLKLGLSTGEPAATPADELRVFPFELRAGDPVTDPEGREWEVTGRPAAYRQGKMVAVRLQKPGEPNVIDEQHWDAHERIRVRRL
jgi:hypothetical protein